LKINGLTVMVKLDKLLNTKGIYQMKRLPSMSVTVEIKTGTRRLMEFLLAPLMRGVSVGARER
jgi:hemolysin D